MGRVQILEPDNYIVAAICCSIAEFRVLENSKGIESNLIYTSSYSSFIFQEPKWTWWQMLKKESLINHKQCGGGELFSSWFVRL